MIANYPMHHHNEFSSDACERMDHLWEIRPWEQHAMDAALELAGTETEWEHLYILQKPRARTETARDATNGVKVGCGQGQNVVGIVALLVR